MLRPPVVVRETWAFTSWAEKHWTMREWTGFVDFIARNPLAGALVPATGGVRKIRWSIPGQGKRGGARVIYYFLDTTYPLTLLSAYTKSDKETLTADDKSAVQAIVREIKKSVRSKP